MKNIDLDYWVEQTDGLTLSHLRELIVSVIILENDFEQEIETLKNMGNNISSSTDKTNNAGFLIGTNGKNNNSKKEVKIVGFSAENN
jgi:hypothetical protein